MKRLFSALLCLALIAGSAACSDDETTRPVLVVNAGESFLSLDALARAGKISVTSSLPWRVTAAAGDKWFTLSATEGPAGYSEIEVTFDRNEGPARSAQLAFASEDLIVPFVMSQSAPKDGYDARRITIFMPDSARCRPLCRIACAVPRQTELFLLYAFENAPPG